MITEEFELIKLKQQLHAGKISPKEHNYKIENKKMFPKPDGGTWTSSFEEESGSSWMAFCGMEQVDWLREKGFVCKIDKKAKILKIDTLADLKGILRNYGVSKTPLEGQTLDFEKLSKDYDGVHLTEGGQWRTRLTTPDNLYGWDVESTVFFRDVFSTCNEIDLVPWREKYLKSCKID